MNVLLIVSIPDSKRNSAWFASADILAINEAVRGLAMASARHDATIVTADHLAVIAILSAFLPSDRLRVIQRGAEPVLDNVERGILIGGCEDELALARRVVSAGIQVTPIASTGGASAELMSDLAIAGKADRDETHRLKTDTAYAPLFDRLLSS